MKIMLGAKEVEVEKAFPLQLRDLRRLKKEFNVEFGVNGFGENIENQAAFFLVMFQKLNPEITAEDVDNITLPQMNEITAAAAKASRVVDVPFSASSTS